MASPPAIPPGLVSFLCPMTRPEQARACGVSVSTLARHLRVPWKQWPVGLAEEWCRVCGFDFWNLRFDTPEHLALLARVRWTPVTKRLRRVLTALYRAAGTSRPTQDQIEELARTFEKLARS